MIEEGGIFVPDTAGLRDQRGLLKNVEYKFTPEGLVDWRAMIPEEFLYPNREWFESRQMPVPKTIEGLEDNQLLVKLGGIKHVARLRGYSCVDYEWAPHCQPDHVAVKCTIVWLDNYETTDISRRWTETSFSALANASTANMSDFVAKFPECIAENRAFVRCVRNFLNINVVGDDEIDRNKEYAVSKEGTSADKSTLPNEILQRVVDKKLNITKFSDFMDKLRELYENRSYEPTIDAKELKKWKGFTDIPAAEVRNIIGTINKL